MDLIIRNIMIFERKEREDIGVEDAQIEKIMEKANKEINVDGRLTSLALIDPHVHLDKVGNRAGVVMLEASSSKEGIRLHPRRWVIGRVKNLTRPE